MKIGVRAFLMFLLALPLVGLMTGCENYDKLVDLDATCDQKWADVQAQLQRRYDLIPNLVATVKGYAQQEKSVLTEVTQARASATQIKLSPADLSDPQKVSAFSDAQNRVTLSLQRLQEAYPDLKSNANFLALQDQLEGTENRINASRRDYNDEVRKYNTLIRTFPTAIGAKVFYGAKPKVPFEAAAAAQQAPSVNFNAG